MPLKLQPKDLPQESKERLLRFAVENGVIDSSLDPDYVFQDPSYLLKLRNLIWEPQIWLNKTNLIEDYTYLTSIVRRYIRRHTFKKGQAILFNGLIVLQYISDVQYSTDLLDCKTLPRLIWPKSTTAKLLWISRLKSESL